MEHKTKAKMTDAQIDSWLRGRLLRCGIILCEQLREEAAELGISKSQLKAARKRVGVRTWHQFDESGATPNWFWRLE